MKRDFDLIRMLLLSIESDEEIEDTEKNNYHLILMTEAGYINSVFIWIDGAKKVLDVRMAWNGQEVLDIIKNIDYYMRAKSILEDSGVESVSFEIFLEIIKKIIIENEYIKIGD